MDMQQSTTSKNERIAARVSKKHKSLFEQAARLRGLSLTDFMTNSAYDEALRILEQHETIISLSAADSSHFVDAVLNPRQKEDLPVLSDAFENYDPSKG